MTGTASAPGRAWRTLPAPARAALMAALGALANLAFAPWFLLPVLPVTLGALYLVSQSERWPRAAAAGFWFGLGHFAFGLSWIAEAYRMRPDIPDWLGPPSVLALALYLACYPAAVAGLAAAIPGRARRGMLAPALFAGLWAAGEYLRGILFTGFPWNPLAAGLAFSAPTLQPLAVVGPHAAGLVVALAAVLPAEALRRRPGGAARAWTAWALFLLLLAGWPAAGWLRLAVLSAPGTVPGVTLRLVQPDIDQREKWDPDRAGAHLARLIRLSGSLERPPHGRLVIIWPEAAIPEYRLADQPGRRALIMRMLPRDSLLVTGSPRLETLPDGGWRLFNSLFVLGPHGGLLAVYDKRHLVPFGEYLPARPLLARLGLRTIVDSSVDFSAGRDGAVIALAGLPAFAPAICYEAIFPETARAARRHGARFLLNVTNDAWFGRRAGPHQHLALARMRAAETGLPLVRVAQTGISAVVDGTGRMLLKIGLGRMETRDAPLPAAAPPTPYVRHGESVFAGLLILLVLLAIMAGVRYSISE